MFFWSGLVCKSCRRWQLKEGYRMYFNKQYERWSLNYKNKYVKGSVARFDKHGSHQGAVAESAKNLLSWCTLVVGQKG